MPSLQEKCAFGLPCNVFFLIKIQNNGKTTSSLGPAHISDHFEHPAYFDGFLATNCHTLARMLTLWSHDPPNLGENAENAHFPQKGQNNSENAQKMRSAFPLQTGCNP